MKAVVRTKNITVEVEAQKQKDLFKAVASAYEVFGETKCGCCGSEEIRPMWRTVTTVKGKKTETFEYPEYVCLKCRARLSFGTINDDSGTLYPQRKLVDGHPPTKEERENGLGSYGPTNGWYKYQPQHKQGE